MPSQRGQPPQVQPQPQRGQPTQAYPQPQRGQQPQVQPQPQRGQPPQVHPQPQRGQSPQIHPQSQRGQQPQIHPQSQPPAPAQPPAQKPSWRRQVATENRAQSLRLPGHPDAGQQSPLKREGSFNTRRRSSGVYQSDGSFFESFTALTWKQENRKRRAASEDEKGKEDDPLPESPGGIRSKARKFSQREFELLYIEVLYTIKHKIGITSGSHLPFIQDLYLYAREAFGVTPEEHARLLARASEEKPPILILNCDVIEARDLEAKDPDGFSDPYCMLGVIPGSRLWRERHPFDGRDGSPAYSSDEEPRNKRESTSALKRLSRSFKKKKDNKTARDQIPARFIKTTNVKPNTLNPVWNETFRFDLEEVNADSVHLDIWDHDDEFSVVDAAKRLNEVQGVKGLARYFKQIAQSARTSNKDNVDDFLGSININLHDIPSTGLDRWFDLEGRSARSNVEGQIRLRMSLSTREDRGVSEEEDWTESIQHERLLRIFIEHEMKSFEGQGYLWKGMLSQAAVTILHQHAIQGDITDLQQSACRWAAYSAHQQHQNFDWDFLIHLLDDLEKKWDLGPLSREQEDSLRDSFSNFIDFCLELVRQQRFVYPCSNRKSLARMRGMLTCLGRLYNMKCFYACCPFHKELTGELIAVVKKSTSDWYHRLHQHISRQMSGEEETLSAMTDLINRLNTDLQRGLTYYTPIYEHATNFGYFQVLYKHLEKLLDDSLSVGLQQVSFSIPEVTEQTAHLLTPQQTGMLLFEMYLALHEFCQYKLNLPSNERRNLGIIKYHDWFRSPVQRWLSIAKHKTIHRIKKSVEMDQADQADSQIKQSTSAIDVACCFGQVVEFWRRMGWPDDADALPFVTKITEDICDAAIFYADLIHAKLKSAGYYDEEGQFDVTEQLCRTINDIEQVRRALRPLPEALRYREIAQCMELKSGERTARQAFSSLVSIVKSADDNMGRKIKQVVDRVADKMRPDIKKDVFHLCWSPERVPADEAIGDLMNYLDSNLVTLNTNLLRANFDRILDSIWVEVLEEMMEVLVTEEVKANWFFERLYDALAILVDFFHADGKGLSKDIICSTLYNDLRRQLQLNKAATPQVIEMYYMEKMTEQEQYEGKEFGTLSVRVYYNTDAEILLVEVLNAKNVIPLDPNGLSDPFVLIELVPQHTFPHQTLQQTQVVKKTLHPTFDESFEFNVSVAECRRQGACVHFTVMDHDIMFSNDFAGEAFLALDSIPGISGENVSGFSALTPVALLLTQPKKGKKTRAKGALAALEFRADDRTAMDFLKKRRQVESQSQG